MSRPALKCRRLIAAVRQAIAEGRTKTAKAWAAEFGVTRGTVYTRAGEFMVRSAMRRDNWPGVVVSGAGIFAVRETKNGARYVHIGAPWLRAMGAGDAKLLIGHVEGGRFILELALQPHGP